MNAPKITVSNVTTKDGQKSTVQTYTVKHGDSVQKIQSPNIAQIVQTSTGQRIILANPHQSANARECNCKFFQNSKAPMFYLIKRYFSVSFPTFPIMTSTGQRLTVVSKQIIGLSTTPVSMNKVIGGVVTSSTGRPVMRVSPLNVTAAHSSGQVQTTQIRVTRAVPKELEKSQAKETPKSEYYLVSNDSTSMFLTIASIRNK